MTTHFKPLLILGCALVGFVFVVAAQARPAKLERRLPRNVELAQYIDHEQDVVEQRRDTVAGLRDTVERLRKEQGGREKGSLDRESAISRTSQRAGLAAVRGAGLRVTLSDSSLERSPSGNVNDLVIHSEDVQAAVNALWQSGADAISINGQRLVGTSAVLCVGNTLLLNGTVHSPPYVISAIGASRDLFEADPLVQQLRERSTRYEVGFSIDEQTEMTVPAYESSTEVRHAQPVD